MSACKSCGAPILWATTEKGRTMPIDPEPSPDGNLEFLNGRVFQVRPGEVPAGPLHNSHFATCPNADEHRRSGGSVQ